MVFKKIFDAIYNLVFGEPDPELIRLDSGKSACSACNKKISGRRIFQVPLSDKHYCREHAREEMDKIREESFKEMPEGLKTKVHFSLEEGYFIECHDCQKKMHPHDHEAAECQFCHEPLCKEHAEHSCPQKEEAQKEQAEAKIPRRCSFCGTKIVSGSAFKCQACAEYHCHAHKTPEHHNCKGVKI